MDWMDFSSRCLTVAFFLYCFSFLFFVISLTGKRWSHRDPKQHMKRWSRLAFILAAVGLASQIMYFVTRWIGGGHVPTSNMFEFMTFLGMMIMAAFIFVYAIYRAPIIGAFTMPIGVIILAYAAVFPSEVQPLIPALKSYWLYIHVTTAAAGEAFFAVGFATGFMYLLRTVNYQSKDQRSRKEQLGIEFTFFVILVIVGFIGLIYGFQSADYHAQFTQEQTVQTQDGQEIKQNVNVDYTLPPLVKPYNSEAVSVDPYFGLQDSLIAAPSWMKGINAGRKFNTVIWSLLGGIVLYALLRLLFRKPLGAVTGRILDGVHADDLDEISYRAIAIGFPVFTLGALIFAMIWAAEAWGRFWAFDPKETWALITWFFYTLYLHLRLSKGWQGKKSAWMAVIGFIVVMFTLVGINLVVAGLHSYAGV